MYHGKERVRAIPPVYKTESSYRRGGVDRNRRYGSYRHNHTVTGLRKDMLSVTQSQPNQSYPLPFMTTEVVLSYQGLQH